MNPYGWMCWIVRGARGRPASVVRTGPRQSSPFESLLYVGAVSLAIIDQFTTIHLAQAIERIWPSGSFVYYGLVGIAGLAGLVAVNGRRWIGPDSAKFVKRWVALESSALVLLAFMYAIRVWGCAVIGLSAAHTFCDSLVFCLACLWRVRQIWADLTALDQSQEAVAQSIAVREE